MKKFLMMLTTIIYVFMAGNCAFAQNSPENHNSSGILNKKQKMHQKHKEKFKQKKQEIKNRLNLTEEQKAKAKVIHEEAKPKIKPIIEKMRKKIGEIQQLKQSGASREEIMKKVEEIKALKQEANQIRKKNVEKFESILTPEQKAEFEKIKSEIEQKREQMRNKLKEQREKRIQKHKMEMN